MSVLTDSLPLTTTAIPALNSLLRRLDQNQKTVTQCYGKLCSYQAEPHTYEQFQQLGDLKEGAHELRDANEQLLGILRNERQVPVDSKKLVQKQLQNFYSFSLEVDTYMKNVKLPRSAF